MKKIFFIRHGEGYHNLMNYNYHNWHLMYPRLTTNGINQCYQLKEKLKSEKFDLILVSPLRRTLETAEYIFDKSNTFVANEDIREVLSNPCDLRESITEILRSYDYVNLDEIPENESLEIKESNDNINKRIESFYKYLDKLPIGNYAVVSHFEFLKRFLSKYGINMCIENAEFKNCECKIGIL
jgi:broad specificity phosphatase PhoE